MGDKMKKKKNNKKSNILSSILFILSLIFILSLYVINILPYKYLAILTISILIINIIVNIKLKKKKNIKYIFISIILIAILSISSFYLIKTNNLLDSFNISYKTHNYKVIVLKDSNYNDVKDINNMTVGYYINSEEINNSLNKFNSIVNTDNIEYKDIYSLANDLLTNKISSVLIEDSFLDIINKNEDKLSNINNFKDLTKEIYSYKIKVNISNLFEDINVTEEPFNIYISGIDTYDEISSANRSDVNIIATINPKKNKILLTSIPRDYYIKLYKKNGYKDKLTHAGLYGIDTQIHTLEDLLDIKINYYLKVNFTSIINITDALNGLDIYSDYDFTSIDGYSYKKGYNSLSGKKALSFIRERKAFAEGDNQRIKNQQYFIKALLKKCTDKKIIVKYNKLLNSLNNSFITNMPQNKITKLIRNEISNKKEWNIMTNSLTGTDYTSYTYSMPNTKSYVMIPNEESIKKAKIAINDVIVDDDTKIN